MLFDDPEGPNLLIVTVMAVVIYFLALSMYSFIATKEITPKHFSVVLPISLKKFFQIILVQLIVAGAFYLLFKWI